MRPWNPRDMQELASLTDEERRRVVLRCEQAVTSSSDRGWMTFLSVSVMAAMLAVAMYLFVARWPPIVSILILVTAFVVLIVGVAEAGDRRRRNRLVEAIRRYMTETPRYGRSPNCPACGYDQRGTTTQFCPECGESIVMSSYLIDGETDWDGDGDGDREQEEG